MALGQRDHTRGLKPCMYMCKASSVQKLTETWQQFVTNLENYIYVKVDLIVIASYMYTARASASYTKLLALLNKDGGKHIR